MLDGTTPLGRGLSTEVLSVETDSLYVHSIIMLVDRDLMRGDLTILSLVSTLLRLKPWGQEPRPRVDSLAIEPSLRCWTAIDLAALLRPFTSLRTIDLHGDFEMVLDTWRHMTLSNHQ